jgi:endonuclease III
MARPARKDIVRAALDRCPQSTAERLGIDLSKNTPAPLYRWLIASLLFSARISAAQAENAARALFDEGWRTPEKMAATTWEARVKVLNRSGYARYDESTARYIADTTQLLLDDYGGDLRRLRAAARQDPAEERKRLKAFKGIGEVGADIFFREAQLAWAELYPFADRKSLQTAEKLGLGEDAEALARLVTRKRDLPRLLTALIQASHTKEAEALLAEASKLAG